MKRTVVLSLFLLLPFALEARASERPVIKVDIEETWLWKGKKQPSPINMSQYVLTEFFTLHGFDVIAPRKSRYYKYLNSYLSKRGYANFQAWQSTLQGKSPKFVVTGKAFVKPKRRSTFYGSTVAFVYKGNLELSLKDSSGNLLGRFYATIEYGKPNRGKYPEFYAAKGCLRNLALRMCVALYKVSSLKPLFQGNRSRLEKRLEKIEEEFKDLKGTFRVLKEGASLPKEPEKEAKPEKQPKEEPKKEDDKEDDEDDEEGPF